MNVLAILSLTVLGMAISHSAACSPDLLMPGRSLRCYLLYFFGIALLLLAALWFLATSEAK